MALIILTKSLTPNFIESLKRIARKILGKKRGPQAVTASLIRGLHNLHYPYKINPKTKDIGEKDTIWVNESLGSLRYAIDFKQKGHENKLIAGPNLVICPDEHASIIFNPKIDIILQPSLWTKKLYEKYNQAASSRLHIWPAGVADPYEKTIAPVKDTYFVLYEKHAPKELVSMAMKSLEAKNISIKIIRYGSFKHEEFLSLLDKAAGMIYLSPSESQGIALQEAWIRDVPTLVWDREFWEYGGQKFEHPQISCPYLTESSGMTFSSITDFDQKLQEFIRSLPHFKARDYCIGNLTDKITTRHYLDIIEK